MPKKATDIVVVSKACQEYWGMAKNLVDEAGTYAGRIKLKNNLLDSSTAWKVKGVFAEYYSGQMANLDNRIAEAKYNFLAKVEKMNVLCKSNGVTTIKNPEALLNLLLSESKRNSFKGKIKTRLKNGEICPLQDFVQKKK